MNCDFKVALLNSCWCCDLIFFANSRICCVMCAHILIIKCNIFLVLLELLFGKHNHQKSAELQHTITTFTIYFEREKWRGSLLFCFNFSVAIAQYIPSKRGGVLLVDEMDYTYSKHRVVPREGCMAWRCTERAVCQVIAKTGPNGELLQQPVHNHPPREKLQ